MGTLVEAIQNRTVLVLSNYYSKFPDTWNYFINFIDYGVQQSEPDDGEQGKQELEQNGRYRKGLVAFWGHMTILADRPKSDIFPGLAEIKGDLVSKFGKDPRGSLAIINLSSIEKKIEKHDDETDNLYIQCIGFVTWRVYEGQTDTYTDYTLTPGDIMYMPSGTQHEVFPNSPRCAIVFGFESEA